MIETLPPQVLFSLPLVIRSDDAEQLATALSELWLWQMQRELGAILTDLDALERFFDPLATGKRLRGLLSELPPAPSVRARWLEPPIVIRYSKGFLIAPEGRAILGILQSLLSSSEPGLIVIDPDSVYAAEHWVYERYRRWSLKRLEGVVALMSGKAEALRLPSIGLLLLLLVNRSLSSSTALRSLPDRSRQDRLDAVVSNIVEVFSNALDGRPRDKRQFVLYSGYPLTEALRRLPNALCSERHNGTHILYIVPSEEDHILALIVAEMRRSQRSFSTSQVLKAFDQLVAEYRSELPTLAAFDMVFEQRAETRRLRQRLEALLGDDDSSS